MAKGIAGIRVCCREAVKEGLRELLPTFSRSCCALVYLSIVFYAIAIFIPTLTKADEGDPLFARGAGFYAQSKWEEAFLAFEELRTTHPTHSRSPDATFFGGECLIQLGEYGKAYERFDALLQSWPTTPHRPQALFRLGESALMTERLPLAEKWLLEFHDKYPEDGLSRYVETYLGQIALEKRDWEKARVHFEIGLKGDPESSTANECRAGIARALEEQGDYPNAIRMYRHVAVNAPEQLASSATLRLASLERLQGNLAAAKVTLIQFLSRHADSPLAAAAYFEMGAISFTQNRYTEATEWYQKVLAEDLVDQSELAAKTLASLGKTWSKIGDSAKAEEAWDRLLREYPNSPTATDAEFSLLSRAFEKEEKQKFVELATTFLDRHPMDQRTIAIQELLGRQYYSEKDYELAAKAFSAAIERLQKLSGDLPESAAREAELQLLKGLSLVGTRNFRDAIAVLTEALAPNSLLKEQLDTQGSGFSRLPQAECELAHQARLTCAQELNDAELVQSFAAEYLQKLPSGAQSGTCRRLLLAKTIAEGDWDRATQELEAIQRTGTPEQYSQSLREISEAALASGYFAECQVWAKKLYASTDDLSLKSFASIVIAKCLNEEGDKAGSKLWYEKALASSNEKEFLVPTWLALGEYHFKNQTYSESLRAYEAAIELAPESREEIVAHYYAGIASQKLGAKGDLENALQHFEFVLKHLAAFDEREQIDRFTPSLEQLGVDRVLYQVSWVYRDMKQPQQAEGALLQLLEEYPNSTLATEARFRMAELAATQRRYEDAGRLLDEVLRSDHSTISEQTHYLRGQIAAAQNDWPTVQESMRTLLRDFPESELRFRAKYWQAEATFRQAAYESALKEFDELLRSTVGNSEEWVAHSALRKAQIEAQLGKWDAAFSSVNKAKSDFPNFRLNYEFDLLLGRYYTAEHEYSKGREYFEKVAKHPVATRTESAAMAEWLMGESYLQQKKYQEALLCYQRVESVHDFPRWKSAALLQSGKCHEMLGNWREAVATYTRCQTEFGETPFASEASQRLKVAHARMNEFSTR